MKDHELKVAIRQKIWDYHINIDASGLFKQFEKGQTRLFSDGVTMRVVDDILFGEQNIPYSWMFECWFQNMPIEQLYGWWVISEQAYKVGRFQCQDMSRAVGKHGQADVWRHVFKRVRGGFDWVCDYGSGVKC